VHCLSSRTACPRMASARSRRSLLGCFGRQHRDRPTQDLGFLRGQVGLLATLANACSANRLHLVYISDEQLDEGGTHLNGLCIRLSELDKRISDHDYAAARRSLAEAFRHFNGLARIIDPEQVVSADEGGTEGDADESN